MSKTILLVEDEEDDVLFMRLAMQESQVQNQIVVARDGQQAVEYVNSEGEFADRKKFPVPGLILLDLKLPYVPGMEVLIQIRKNREWARVPVVIFSSSNQDSDVEAAHKLGANAYIVKPAYTELLKVVRRLKKYWIEADGPPPNCSDWLEVTVPPPVMRRA